jgi:hypothetical protein
MRLGRRSIFLKKYNSRKVAKNEVTTLIEINKDEFSKLIITLNLEIMNIAQTIDTTDETKIIKVLSASFGLSFLPVKLNKFTRMSITSEIIV